MLQSDVEKLNAKYLKEIKELAGLRSNIDRLTQKEIARLETARATAQAAIANADQDGSGGHSYSQDDADSAVNAGFVSLTAANISGAM